jgi:hypothetical protein
LSKLKEAALHLDKAQARHQEVGDHHADVRVGVGRMADLAAEAKRAHVAGRHGEVNRLLGKIADEASLTNERHAAARDSHRALGRSLRSASELVRSAAEAQGYSDLTPQTSDGITDGVSAPREMTPEAIRKRDRQRAIQHAYDARMRLEGGRR